MTSVNKVILVGNLGRDPEVRYLNPGRSPIERLLWLQHTIGRFDSGTWAVKRALEEMRDPLSTCSEIYDQDLSDWELPDLWCEEWFCGGIAFDLSKPYLKTQHVRNCLVSTRHRQMKQRKPCGGFFSASKANLRNAP